jgi:ABC-type sugar transport system ATPase subunit
VVCVVAWWWSVCRDLGDGGAGAVLVDDGLACCPGGDQASIADNIADGAPGATREQVVAAARAAQADGFIQALPNAYDTILDAEGSGLNAGQKQLITIARAFSRRSCGAHP